MRPARRAGLALLLATACARSGPPPVSKPEPPRAAVTEQHIRDVVQRNRQSIAVCYEQQLRRDRTFTNVRIDVEVRIGLAGEALAVVLADAWSSTEIGTCLADAIRTWRFPVQDSAYRTAFPLLFQLQ